MQFQLGIKKKVVVCRQAFRLAYGLSRDYLNTVSQEVRAQKVNDDRPFNDLSNPCRSKEVLQYCNEMDEQEGFNPTPDQVAAGVISNSPEAWECWGWMKYHFNLVGDYQPNSNGEIHLEPCTVVDIWKIYQRDQIDSNKLCSFNYKQFGELWLKCFR